MCLLKWYIECRANLYNCKFWYLQIFVFKWSDFSFVNLIWVLQIYQTKSKWKAIQRNVYWTRKDIVKKYWKQGSAARALAPIPHGWQMILILFEILGFETLESMISQALNIIFAIIAFFSFHYSLLFTISMIFFILMVNLPKIFTKKMENKAVYFTEKNEVWN